MKKQKILKVLNMFLAITFLVVVIAMILYKFIPSELQGDETVLLIHGWGGRIFILLGILHFILNFNWLKAMYFKKKK